MWVKKERQAHTQVWGEPNWREIMRNLLKAGKLTQNDAGGPDL
jgi:hypothetical protein